jgi:hypothetical protein
LGLTIPSIYLAMTKLMGPTPKIIFFPHLLLNHCTCMYVFSCGIFDSLLFIKVGISPGYFASIYWPDFDRCNLEPFPHPFSSFPHTIMSARSPHSAASSRHSNQLIRPRRLDPTTYFNRISNKSRLIDKWLDQVCKQAGTSGRPLILDGSMPVLDYGPQVIICRVERQIHKVNPYPVLRISMPVFFFFLAEDCVLFQKPVEDPNSIFTESDRYELYLTTLSSCSSLGGGTPFALPTSSRILLESYAGSPDDMSAPLWTGLQHDRTEFVQTQAELSAFLAEYRKMESSQVGTLLVADASML